jgi:hypothetical protein
MVANSGNYLFYLMNMSKNNAVLRQLRPGEMAHRLKISRALVKYLMAQ